MILVIIAMSLQASGFDPPVRCSGSSFIRTCFLSDGGRYTERMLEAGRRVRDGVDADGTTWTETEIKQFDGTRTSGSDSRRRTWTYSYSPKFGTRGTNRQGAPFFTPPSHDPEGRAD